MSIIVGCEKSSVLIGHALNPKLLVILNLQTSSSSANGIVVAVSSYSAEYYFTKEHTLDHARNLI